MPTVLNSRGHYALAIVDGPVQTVGMVFHLRLRRFVWRWTSG